MRNYIRERPFALPRDLADLKGPSSGKHELPSNIYWGPLKTFDLSVQGIQHSFVKEIILHADQQQLSSLLSKELLVRHWPDLWLPEHIQKGWENRFPELYRIKRNKVHG